MKHAGKAGKAGVRLILISFVAAAILSALGTLVARLSGVSTGALALPWWFVWVVFVVFTLNFFRDPDPRVPPGNNLVLAPAHGKVDAIGLSTEPEFMGGECRRVSIFLSVIDIHVQNAPVPGRIAFYKYTQGRFLSALKAESAIHNENLLLGFEASEPPGLKVGVRVIAGVLARRIVPWAREGDVVARGERLSLVQFGSRADVYLPPRATVKVNLGDHVVGGVTILAVVD